jgi:hypothetical protein
MSCHTVHVVLILVLAALVAEMPRSANSSLVAYYDFDGSSPLSPSVHASRAINLTALHRALTYRRLDGHLWLLSEHRTQYVVVVVAVVFLLSLFSVLFLVVSSSLLAIAARYVCDILICVQRGRRSTPEARPAWPARASMGRASTPRAATT